MQASTRTLMVTAVVGLLLATAGCSEGESQLDVSDAPPGSALQANATDAMQDVDTAALSMNMTVVGEQTNERLAIDADGAINLTQRAMRMNATADVMGSAEFSQYVLGDTMYMQNRDGWVRQNLTEDFWVRGNTQLSARERLLRNATVNVTGTDRVDGHDVWVLSVEPDPDELERFTRQQGVTGVGTGAGTVGDDVDLSAVEITQYVDAESYQVRRLTADLSTTIRDRETSMSVTMGFSEIDDPKTIELPDGARDATPIQRPSGRNGSQASDGADANATGNGTETGEGAATGTGGNETAA